VVQEGETRRVLSWEGGKENVGFIKKISDNSASPSESAKTKRNKNDMGLSNENLLHSRQQNEASFRILQSLFFICFGFY